MPVFRKSIYERHISFDQLRREIKSDKATELLHFDEFDTFFKHTLTTFDFYLVVQNWRFYASSNRTKVS